MSRIGKRPIPVPEGVEVDIKKNKVTVKGKLGELSIEVDSGIKVVVEDNQIKVKPESMTKQNMAKYGLYRSLINNIVVGVSQGFSKTLKIVGVGYRAAVKGNNLEIMVGYSNPVVIEQISGITFEVPDNTTIIVRGIDKQLVGKITADIRDIRKPEPYKGKGIRYENEYVRKKVGKAAITAGTGK
ncbi:MAG: 50S ribosomal protein L6 [Actinomycetia bacterium]|nr:50S ribosomal protein L6 [Actinomycetes bacterium]